MSSNVYKRYVRKFSTRAQVRMNKGSSKERGPHSPRFAEGDGLKGGPSERERTGQEAKGEEEMHVHVRAGGERDTQREKEERMAVRLRERQGRKLSAP